MVVFVQMTYVMGFCIYLVVLDCLPSSPPPSSTMSDKMK